jgi:hypothetical protein
MHMNYQDIEQAIQGGADTQAVLEMIADDKAPLTDAQMDSLIEDLAEVDALAAIEQGATAPWGDGDVAPTVRFPTQHAAKVYDAAFRATIDAEAEDRIALTEDAQ